MKNRMLSASRGLPWALAILLISTAQALEVTPNSPCSPFCLNNIQDNPKDGVASYTIARDVICEDWEFDGPNATVKGRKWVDCLNCEKTSTAVDKRSSENDVYWFLFNMKFTLDWCVFGYPDNANIIPANEKCAEVCAGPNNSAKRSLTDRLLQTNQTLQYLYCDGPDINDLLDDCAACLNKVPNAKALANYAETLKTACVQKPELGQTVTIDYDLFPPASTPTSVSPNSPAARTETQTETVTETAAPLSPPPSPAAVLASSASVLAASASASAASKASHDKNVRIGVGVGVGVGVALAILAVVCLILVRRRSAQGNQSEEETRARWERDYQADMQQKQIRERQRMELGDAAGVVEADDGRPNEVPMLENHVARESPGTWSSSGGGDGLGNSGDGSWASSPRESRASRTGMGMGMGMSKMFGTKPTVPAKN